MNPRAQNKHLNNYEIVYLALEIKRSLHSFNSNLTEIENQSAVDIIEVRL
jgi:hypothetical protein